MIRVFLKKIFQMIGFAGMAVCYAEGEMQIKVLHGKEIAPYVQDITALCLTVYREYPYLYEGTVSEYEPYIQSYADSPNGIVCLLFEGDRLVGATTGIPIHEMRDRFQEPFKKIGEDLTSIFYLGEMVLLKGYRGKRYASQMYFEFEQSVKDANRYAKICFCTIKESEDHPLKPAGYVSLEDVCIRAGFIKHEELNFTGYWTVIGETEESPQHLYYWIKNFAL
jgi:hypothetical protein